MAGLLTLFQSGEFGLGGSRHSRKLPGNKDLEVPFTAYNVVGAAQEAHFLITAPLPYKGNASGPIVDTVGATSAVGGLLDSLGTGAQ